MQSADDPEADAALFDFLEQLQRDRRAERVRPLAEYLQRFPSHQETIAREYLAAAGGGSRVGGRALPADAAVDGDRFGAYRVRRLLGRGGQGAVYLAEDTRLQRDVALKILDRIGAIGSAHVERLRREAKALAGLDHPGICAVYEADLAGDRPFLAMRYVRGETLAARLAKAATQRSEAEHLLAALPRTANAIALVLQFVERAAHALAVAHESGLVHRDVKPANIMVDGDGMPVLLDFGLARQVDDAAFNLTLTGEVFGTLAYMSPEQLAANGDLDERTDVYSLGVTLYECLTLQLPFRKDTREVLEREIRSGALHDPRAINPAISRDLGVVIGKAMERDRERRYPTARAFAEDLANVRERRSVQARPAGAGLRAWRWCQRHPVVAAVGFLLFLLVGVMAWGLWEIEGKNRRLAFWQQQTAILQRSEERPAEALGEMIDLAGDDEQPQTREALHTLLSRNHEAWRLPLAVHGPSHVPVGSDGEQIERALSVDAGRDRFVCGSNWGYLFVHRVTTGELVRCHKAHDRQISVVTITAGDRYFVSGSFDGKVRWWPCGDLGDGPPTAELAVDAPVFQVCYDASGARLAVAYGVRSSIDLVHANPDGTPRAGERTTLSGHRGRVVTLAFSPDGTRLVSVALGEDTQQVGSHELRVWDVASGRCLLELDAAEIGSSIGHPHWVGDSAMLAVALCEGRGLRFYADGEGTRFREVRLEDRPRWIGEVPDHSELMVTGMDGITLVDPSTMATRRVVSSASERYFEQAVWSPDRRHVAVAVRDSSVRVFEAATWTEVARLKKHTAFVNAAAWSGDGRRLVTVDHEFLHGWHYLARPFLVDLVGHRGRAMSVEFAPDSRHVVTAGEDGTVRLWDRTTATQTAAAQMPGPRQRARLSPSGKYLVTLGESNDAYAMRVGTPMEAKRVTGHEGRITEALFAIVGGAERVVTIGTDGMVRVCDPDDVTRSRTYDAKVGALRCAAVDARRGWLAVGGDGREVAIFDLASGEQLRSLRSDRDAQSQGIDGALYGMWFLPESGRLVVTAANSPATFWDPDHDWRRSEVGLGGTAGLVAADAGERWLVVAERSIEKMLWVSGDLAQKERRPASEPTSWISALRVRPQGDIGLAASRDGQVWLYDWRTRERWSVLRGDHGAVLDACFSPDGAWIAAAYRNGHVVVWPVDPRSAAAGSRLREVSRGGG